MVAAYSVALVGFTQAESATFESFFRMAARRPPSYTVQDEVMDAQILIVNADNTQALHLVRYAELPGKILLVGQSDGGTGWPLQLKPVKLVSVLNALDVIVGVRPSAAAAKRLLPTVLRPPSPSRVPSCKAWTPACAWPAAGWPRPTTARRWLPSRRRPRLSPPPCHPKKRPGPWRRR